MSVRVSSLAFFFSWPGCRFCRSRQAPLTWPPAKRLLPLIFSPAKVKPTWFDAGRFGTHIFTYSLSAAGPRRRGRWRLRF